MNSGPFLPVDTSLRSDPIRIAVIGLGRSATRHLSALAHNSAFQLVALCDIDTQRLDRVSRQQPSLYCFDDFGSLLRQVELDAICICTPNYLHKQMVIEALSAGLHVLCEKPLALNASEVREIIDVQKTTDLRVMVSHRLRFDRESLLLKKKIRQGELGELYFCRANCIRRKGVPDWGKWFTRKKLSGGGSLIDIGVHMIDLGLWLMDFPTPSHALGTTGRFMGGLASDSGIVEMSQFNVDDFASGQIQFAGGKSMQVLSAWESHSLREGLHLEVWGTRGSASLFPFETNLGTGDADSGSDSSAVSSSLSADSSVNQLSHFAQAIHNRDLSQECGTWEAFQTMTLIDALYAGGIHAFDPDTFSPLSLPEKKVI